MTDEGIHRLGSADGPPTRPAMTVIGCGGAGCNTLGRAHERGMVLGHHVATNTDAQHLLSSHAHRKVLLGRITTGGRGANADMALGERGCIEASDQLADVLAEADIVVVLSGLGGGTGSGAAPVISEMARRGGALAIALSTLPFSVEGPTRRENAEVGRASLTLQADLSLVLPNDHLLESSPGLGLLEAFREADDAMLEPVSLLRRLITRADLPTLTRLMRGHGTAHMGRGRSNRRRGYSRALDAAITSLYPPVPPSACDRALVIFEAPQEEPTDGELKELVRSLHLSMHEGAETLWGVCRDDQATDELAAVVVLGTLAKR